MFSVPSDHHSDSESLAAAPVRRIVLRCAEGLCNRDVAKQLWIHEATVCKWRIWGTSFGGATVIYTGGVELRAKAVGPRSRW